MQKLFCLSDIGNGARMMGRSTDVCFVDCRRFYPVTLLASPDQCLFACFQISLFRRSSDWTRDCYDNALHS